MSTNSTAQDPAVPFMEGMGRGTHSTVAEHFGDLATMTDVDILTDYEARWFDYGIAPAGSARETLGRRLAVQHYYLTQAIGGQYSDVTTDLPEGCPSLAQFLVVDATALAIGLHGSNPGRRYDNALRLKSLAALLAEVSQGEM